MTKKEELKDYEENVALEKAGDMFEGGSLTGQNWRTSLFEAHINAIIGAPMAIGAHVGMLLWAGVIVTWENALVFASASWPVFFYLSVGRIFAFRRIFDKYGIALEPITLIRKLIHNGNNGKTSQEKG